MEHPITPPDKLVAQWRIQAPTARDAGASRERWIATQAARWGDDQRLEACCAFIGCGHSVAWSAKLRDAMRPKPPSLAEQAKQELTAVRVNVNHWGCQCDTPIVNRALNRLAELEALSDD